MVALVGLHGRADGRMQPADYVAVRRARVEAVKLLTTAAPEDVDRLREINPAMLVMVRLYADFRARRVSPADFASWVAPEMRGFYERGVRLFELHNEPNLIAEGLGHSWENGSGFAYWFVEVRDRLRRAYPDALFGFPGLSPGATIAGVRQDMVTFLTQAALACKEADWLGAHAYWANLPEMTMRHGGLAYLEQAERYPSKALYITEFSNNNTGTDKAVKGVHYADYYASLKGVQAAFSFVVSGSSRDFAHETWRDEYGTMSAIPGLVGQRAKIAIPPIPTPAPAPASGWHWVTAGLLNVRRFPWTGDVTPLVMAQLTKGTRVNVQGIYNGWGSISANSNRWVNMHYLKEQP